MAFIKTNNVIELKDLPVNPEINSELANGIYLLKVHQTMQGLSCELYIKDLFPLPEKLYGDIIDRTRHIMIAYEKSDNNMGVLLEGLSGSGKTLQAKHLCNVLSQSYPVIILSEDSIKYLNYIYSFINQPVVFLCDEFEKQFETIYDQQYLLTLLDGTSVSHNLFILTANDFERINPYLINRPARIRYWFKYRNLPEDTIVEILEDRLQDKSKQEEILCLLKQVKNLSYDNLMSFLEECNWFKDVSPKNLINILNIQKVNLTDFRYSFFKLYDKQSNEIINNYIQIGCNVYDLVNNFHSYINIRVSDTKYNNDIANTSISPKIVNKEYRNNIVTLTLHDDYLKDSIKNLSEDINNKTLVTDGSYLKEVVKDLNRIETIKLEIHLDKQDNEDTFI